MAKTGISAVFLLCIFGTLYETQAGFPQYPFPLNSGIVFPTSPPVFLDPILPVPSPCQTKGSIQIGNKCVLVEATQLSWNEANRYCGQLGYKLMEITSGEDYFNFISYLRSRSLFHFSYWVGAAKLNNLFWHWISRGIPIHTSFWAVTFIDGKGVKEPLADFYKTCGLLDAKRSHFLNTENCLTKHGFVCERDLRGPQVPPPNVPRPHHWWQPTYFDGAGEGGEGDSPCPEGWTFNEEDNKCYIKKLNPKKTYTEAADDCVELGGTLVVIQNGEQNDYVKNLHENYLCWIGLYRNEDSDLVWINGDPYSYNNFPSDQPLAAPANCGAIDHSTGEWSTVDCESVKGYICEKASH